MVRGLALGQVGASNANALLWKEARVALINGLLIGGTVGLATWLWFGDWQLALVIFAALVINLLSAAMAGVLVPLTLKRMRMDPALAGGVILTTVTDVMGFFSFLGLATMVLLR
ncbi:MAG TPA: magnesium transporter, partial [Arenimonas sp.]|nr:magnesium transporter [Arenimonas sp.]